jgi:hypothetical protein
MKQNRTLPQNSLSRLASYSSGAAVGAASLVSSNAAIVYVNAGNQFLVDTTPNNGISAFFPFDLNSDGVNDLRLRTRIDPSSLAMVVAPAEAGSSVSVMGQIITYPYADRLAAGTLIDGSAGFLVLTQAAGNVASMAFGPGYANSQWAFAGQNSGYLGVRFNAGADQHFAWMRLTVEPNDSATPRAITVHEWAYESVPGVGIAAGALPGSVSLLSAVPGWQRAAAACGPEPHLCTAMTRSHGLPGPVSAHRRDNFSPRFSPAETGGVF